VSCIDFIHLLNFNRISRQKQGCRLPIFSVVDGELVELVMAGQPFLALPNNNVAK